MEKDGSTRFSNDATFTGLTVDAKETYEERLLWTIWMDWHCYPNGQLNTYISTIEMESVFSERLGVVSGNAFTMLSTPFELELYCCHCDRYETNDIMITLTKYSGELVQSMRRSPCKTVIRGHSAVARR